MHSRARHPVITAPAVARSDYDPLEPQALAWDDPHRASSSSPSARRRPTSTARDLHTPRVFLTCVRARFSYLLVRLTVRRRPRELRRLLLLRGELLALAVQVQERGGVLLGEAHAVTRVHAQSTEGALFRLEHHDETVARVAKRRTFVPASTARARARARARDAAKPSMLIVLLVLRAWYRSALLSPYPRPYNSNDTYMHHRVRILTLSNPVYVHTRCPPRSDARTRSRAFARRRRSTADARRRATALAEARRRTIARGHRPWS